MKRVILTLLAIATLFCFNSCEDIISGALGGGNNSGESENKIATTAEQIDAIKASLPKLRSTLKSAKSFVSPVETKADSTETTEPTVPPSDSLDQANDNVEEYIRALEEKIELLEEYVYSEQQKEWLASTYATIELYEETVSVLANLQCEIEALKGTLEEAQETLRAEIANSITTCFSSMQSWVNELLTGYYDIATTDAMFAKMQEEFTEADEETRAEIEALRASLAEQFKEMEDSYKSAIKDAIEKSNGVLTEKIEKEIKSVNDRIDEVVATINERLAEIEERLSKLEDSVQALINRIQSIAYIPVYDDANARVNFPNNDTSEGTLTLDFNISPKNAVEDIAKAYQDIITVKVMYTGSSDQINLPVIGCSCNAELGTLTVICACDNLSMEFYHGEVNARAIMHISDGNNDKNSEYIPLTPNLTKIPNNQIWYTVNGKTAVDIKCENGPKIVTNIFDQAKNCYVATFDKDVTSVQASYFAGKTELTTVSLPHSILIIEDSAFEGCSSLTQATLGNSVVSIGSNAFADCNLSSMHFPETLSEMGVNCFDYNEIAYFVGGPTLEDGISLVLGKTLKGVALGGLKEGAYTIPEGINTIGGSVFSGCSSLKEISLHKDITIIEENAFEGCSSLAKVDITDINKWCKLDFANPYANPLCNGAALYQNGSEVVEVIFPNDMTIVKPYAFYGCSSLRSVTLHDKITEVGESAFHGCTNLSSIMMQSTVPPVLKDNVFEGCSNLQIYIPTDEKAVRAYLTCDWYEKYQHMVVWELKELPRTHKIEYTTSNGKILEYNAANIHSHVYSDGKGVITFTIPCTSFSGFKSDQNRLLTCELPESVVSIEDGAFSGCSNLKEFMIPGGITSLGKDLFNGCSSLKSIVIPGNVSEIKESAFRGCSSLTAINIPSNVTSIREFTFAECSALTSVRIHKNISSIEASAFKDCSSLTEVCFEAQTPPSVHETAFDGCDNAKIIIPEDENTVLAYLGGNWSNELLQMIPDYIYTGKLPESYWFEYTTTDSKIVEFKDQNIFYNVYENGKGIALSKAPITSFAGVQSGNERLLTCKLPKGLTQIEYEAFNGCSKLKEFTIPEEVTDILASTFKGCSSLTKFTIHKGIRNIGYYAFKDCSNLTEVRFEAQTPPSVNESAFEGCNNLRIYLPEDEATVKAYLGGSWSNSLLCLIPDNIYTDKLSPNYWIEYTTTDSKTVEFIDQDIFYNIYENSKGIALSKTTIKTFRGILSGNE